MKPEPQQAQTEWPQALQLQQALTDLQVPPSCPVRQRRRYPLQVLARSRGQARRPRGSRRVPQLLAFVGAVVAEPAPDRASLL